MLLKKFNKLFYNIANSFCSKSYHFVPKHLPVLDNDIKCLQEFVENSKKLLILTGAGISTESGIPDYRSEGVGLFARSGYRPIEFQEFLASSFIRQRYWARNYVGWPRFSQVEPSATHSALQKLETTNKISAVVTQNVDSLHLKAGSERVIEIHGTAYEVICLKCPYIVSRHEFQDKLNKLNPDMKEQSDIIRPDGDVHLTEEQVMGFKVPSCPNCRGILKPNIVFFGDNIPRKKIDLIDKYLSESDTLLVLGSSLFVFSGYRITLLAKDYNMKVGIVNIGPTRADDLADLRIFAKCGDIVPKVCQ